MPDVWGSDYDYAEAMGNHDAPEPQDGPADDDPTEADDEDMGAALAARFEVA